MWCYYRANISHAPITSLNGVLVEYLMETITEKAFLPILKIFYHYFDILVFSPQNIYNTLKYNKTGS